MASTHDVGMYGSMLEFTHALVYGCRVRHTNTHTHTHTHTHKHTHTHTHTLTDTMTQEHARTLPAPMQLLSHEQW